MNVEAPLVVICGPTGAGKTHLAVRLASTLPIEVISADSRQVYRGMDIGTGKPTAEEQRAVRHHLIDIVEPDERYHAARFLLDARAAIDEIRQRGRLPVVVGGTGLYIRALLRGLAPAPPADPLVRYDLHRQLRCEGSQALHDRLRSVDPIAAERIHPRDGVRIVRALEIYALTGQPLGSPAHWRTARSFSNVLFIGLTMERDALYRLLDARVDQMIANGLADEVKELLSRGYSVDGSAMRGIGYRHLASVFQGRSTMEEAIRTMKRDTKRYAKRQWTWFQREPEVEWIKVDQTGEHVETVNERVSSWARLR